MFIVAFVCGRHNQKVPTHKALSLDSANFKIENDNFIE